MTSAQGTNVGAPHGAIRARQGEDDAAAVMTTGGGVGLGLFIRRHREALGYSLQELADLAGCTKSHLWMLETGASANPTVSMLKGLAKGLGLPATSVFAAALGQEDRSLRAALERILAEPYGCSFCDSGKLRNPVKPHEEDCGFAMAAAALARPMKAVPREPTQEMMVVMADLSVALLRGEIHPDTYWKAIYDAAPSRASETEALQGNAESPSSSDLNATSGISRPPE